MATPIMSAIEDLVRKILKEDGILFMKKDIEKLIEENLDAQGSSKMMKLVDLRIEKAMDEQVPLEVVRQLHKQFTGEDKPTGGGKAAGKKGKRPRCSKCGSGTKKAEGGGRECSKCHNIDGAPADGEDNG